MKISLNWIKQFTDVSLSVDELVEKIGAQLGAVEEVVSLGKRYQGVVVAKIVSCQPVEGSDHLSLCRIDDGKAVKDVERGGDGLVQVVCGAPNCREGLTVAWLPPGSTVPSSVDTNEPFVLGARELRGHKSNGMLASPRELALGDSHDGILEIDGEAKPGTPFTEVYKLDDSIIDIENKMFTHRPDCFGALGVAREIAGITHQAFKSPDWYVEQPNFPAGSDNLKLSVQNDVPDAVPRFVAVALSGVDVKPSPVWLQVALAKVGVRAINNIVDLTNFYMLVTGQPLHAYDYDKLKTGKLGVRLSQKGEQLKLLGGKQLELEAGDIVITDGERPIGLAGVMGGADTEVDESTKNIVLECANFNMNAVRRAAMKYGLFTDAATRFTKGQSPRQNLAVVAKITEDIVKSGAQVASALIDDSHISGGAAPVKVAAAFINERLGLQLKAADMQKLLENVEFSVAISGADLTVTAPFWRTDIELPEDVVEEVGRLYGYDHVPLELPKRDLTPAPADQLLSLKQQIRAQLVKSGANELLTYSFVHGDLIDKVGQSRDHAFQLSNALSPDLQYYRLSLTPSLLEKVHPNLKAGYDQFALFEMGKGHKIGVQDPEDPKLPNEEELLSVVLAADPKANRQSTGAAYYQAKRYLMSLCSSLGVEKIDFEPFKIEGQEGAQVGAPFEPNRSARVLINDKFVGFVGEFRASVRRALKLPDYVAGFEVELTSLLGASSGHYQPLPRFPKVSQDITLKVAADRPYAEVNDLLTAELLANKGNARLSIEHLGIYQSAEDTGHKNISFRIELASHERTLTDAEVNKLLDQAASAAKAERI